MWVHSRCRGWLGLALAALCAIAVGPAGAQILTSIQTPTPNSFPTQTVTAPDGTIWFVETAADHIGTISPSYTYIGEVNLVLPGSRPTAITLDSNGTAWFTESGLNKIGAYTRATNYLIEYQIPGPNGGMSSISVDSSGKVWFTMPLTNQIGVLDPSQLTINFVPLGSTNVGLQNIATTPFGTGWFTEPGTNQVGLLDLSSPTPTLSQYSGSFSGPWGIGIGQSNSVWLTEQNGGFISSLDPNSGNLFQFPTINGPAAQPKYIDPFQTQGQSFVAWTEPTPGNGLVGILNPSTGQTSQIQATNPNGAPYGVSYANNNTLWWSQANSSSLTGSFFNSSIVWRGPSVGGPILASFLGSFSPAGLQLDLPGQKYRGYRHVRLLHVDKTTLKRRVARVMAIASRPGHAGRLTLILPNRAMLGSRDAQLLLTKLHTTSLDSPPTEAPTQKNSQTAIINVITIGAPSQVKPLVRWFPAPATNAVMRVSAINGAPNNTDQVTIHVGDCINLQLMVKFRTGQFWDVTNDPNTQFLLDPMRGHFTSKNVWCANPEDYNHAFPIYGRLYSPDYGTYITSTIHVVVK